MKLNLHKIHINALNNKSDKRHRQGDRTKERQADRVEPSQMRLINVNKLNIFRWQITDFTRPDEPNDGALSHFIGQLQPLVAEKYLMRPLIHALTFAEVGIYPRVVATLHIHFINGQEVGFNNNL